MIESVYEFYFTFNYPAAYVDSVGDTDEIGVLEFDAGSLVPVIENDINSRSFKINRYFFSGGQKGGIPDVGNGDNDLEGRNSRVKSVGCSRVRRG